MYIFMNDLGLLKNQEKLWHKNQLIWFKEYLSIYWNDIYEKIMNSLKSLDITNIVYLTKIERFKFLRNRSERWDLINPWVTSYLSEYIIDNIKEIKNTVRVWKEYKIKINSKNEVRFEDFYLLLWKSKNKVFSYDLNDIHSYFISAEYSWRENFKLLRLRVLYDLFVDYSNVNIPKVKLALDRISPTEFIIKKR